MDDKELIKVGQESTIDVTFCSFIFNSDYNYLYEQSNEAILGSFVRTIHHFIASNVNLMTMTCNKEN